MTETAVHLVTGATTGLGKETALALAATGATVVAVARDPARGEAAAADIRHRVPDARIDVRLADLSKLDEVRALGEAVRGEYPRLESVVHNAAVAFGDPRVILTTNYLAPFVLTDLLRDRVARVVTVSSMTHRQVKAVPWDDLESGRGVDYPTSKLLDAIFSAELARRLTGAVANAADPGFVRTELGRGATGGFRVFLTLARPFQASPAKGARTQIYLASDPAAGQVTGGYYVNSAKVAPAPLVDDAAVAARLWTLTAELVERTG